MTFFFDECVSKKLAEAMNCLVKPIGVLHLRDHFPKGIVDCDWIPILSDKGWVLLTCDGRIPKNTPEHDALKKANVVSIFIFQAYPRWPKWDQVRWLINNWTKIVNAAKNAKPGTILHIGVRGGISEKRK